MNPYTALALVNLGIITLVGYGIYETQSPWMLVGLIFMYSFSSNEYED